MPETRQAAHWLPPPRTQWPSHKLGHKNVQAGTHSQGSQCPSPYSQGPYTCGLTPATREDLTQLLSSVLGCFGGRACQRAAAVEQPTCGRLSPSGCGLLVSKQQHSRWWTVWPQGHLTGMLGELATGKAHLVGTWHTVSAPQMNSRRFQSGCCMACPPLLSVLHAAQEASAWPHGIPVGHLRAATCQEEAFTEGRGASTGRKQPCPPQVWHYPGVGTCYPLWEHTLR